MAEDRKFEQYDIIQHFKREFATTGKREPTDYLYVFLGEVQHTETGEILCVYKALYGDGAVYARPKEMFYSEVDREKYPDVKQKYRLELWKAVSDPNLNAFNFKVGDVIYATNPYRTSLEGVHPETIVKVGRKYITTDTMDRRYYRDTLILDKDWGATAQAFVSEDAYDEYVQCCKDRRHLTDLFRWGGKHSKVTPMAMHLIRTFTDNVLKVFYGEESGDNENDQ